ncbi:MFS transporter [Amycolatopsis jiangsuensis]|uniref:Putative proline/betaine transporter n=1 Tax=Amycolatopsis jiangsuensis TaxID=1181879 RepID=A0A840ITI5_9PSEU|nr:MFS transporter [Amycolatopsis jiangsuensis]MBB4684468.1 metabolite-proton symporter [Amycolatopsis jiangsuensis]
MTTPVRAEVPRSRIAVASFIGTAIEFYDFYIYGTAAALVFGKVFFPTFSSTAGVLASLGTFAVGFIARPVGAVLFGHWGDRLGRKSMLIVSLLVMGLSTVAVGAVPDYAAIGIWSPVLLTVLRFVQGVGLGGEWGGAVLMSTEYAPPGQRGLYSAFPQLGPAIGFVLGNTLFLVLGAVLPAAEFQAWGWRLPFLFSAVLLVVGFYIRIRIAETPVFQAALDKAEQARVPLFELVRKQPRVLLLSTLSFVLAHALFYTVTTFCLSLATSSLGIPRTTVLVSLLVAAAVMGVATLVFAMKSDKWGRRRLSAAAAVSVVVWAFPLFALMQTKNPLLLTVGFIGGLLCFAMLYGPMGAFLPELFRVRYRYSGASIAYSVSGIVGGGVVPLISTDLHASTGSSVPVSLLLIVLGVVSLLCILGLPETRDHDFADGLGEDQVPAAS